jgi:hypothetical protein
VAACAREFLRQKLGARRQHNNAGMGAFIFVAAAVGIWEIRDYDWFAKIYAATKYSLPQSKIEFEGSRPHDCDFMTAPMGSKHCSYKREYFAEWFTLSKSNQPISYGPIQQEPPATVCYSAESDLAHRCYHIERQPDEYPLTGWRARHVVIRWRKLKE